MNRTVKRYYEIDKEVFKQFSIACAMLNITKKEGVNAALRQFAEMVLQEQNK